VFWGLISVLSIDWFQRFLPSIKSEEKNHEIAISMLRLCTTAFLSFSLLRLGLQAGREKKIGGVGKNWRGFSSIAL